MSVNKIIAMKDDGGCFAKCFLPRFNEDICSSYINDISYIANILNYRYRVTDEYHAEADAWLFMQSKKTLKLFFPELWTNFKSSLHDCYKTAATNFCQTEENNHKTYFNRILKWR